MKNKYVNRSRISEAKFREIVIAKRFEKSLYKFKVIFLPPYSPDLNPIEKFWANLKNFLRNYSKNFKTIQEAITNFFQAA